MEIKMNILVLGGLWIRDGEPGSTRIAGITSEKPYDTFCLGNKTKSTQLSNHSKSTRIRKEKISGMPGTDLTKGQIVFNNNQRKKGSISKT